MNDSSDRAPGTLLYELESIQTLLSEDEEYLKNIPILRDVVSEGHRPASTHITQDQLTPLVNTIPTSMKTTREKLNNGYTQREQLIQDVIDDVMPMIEETLKEKLHQLTDEELQSLLKL